jgi:hypothetical protein
LDFAQALIQKQANYVGNTGYGWGGGGVVYTEALMRNYTRELLRGTQNQIGKALMAAKQGYRSRSRDFGSYDAKILMQSTLYGLPMYRITSGGTLDANDPFPSANMETTIPTTFSELNVGRLNYMGGTFTQSSTEDGTILALDEWIDFSSGTPIQPRLFANISAPAAGTLHGGVFLGGVYSETEGFDPVIALSYNEYVTESEEPTFSASGWYPAVPFHIRSNDSEAQTIATVLGQYNSDTGTERVYNQMFFETYYSNSTDFIPPIISHVDGVLDQSAAQALIKVEASDESEVVRVVVAHTDGQGRWHSQDLVNDDTIGIWTGTITGTTESGYLVQVVDDAGNVAINDNKGRYHPLLSPLPLVGSSDNTLYLPLITTGG